MMMKIIIIKVFIHPFLQTLDKAFLNLSGSPREIW